MRPPTTGRPSYDPSGNDEEVKERKINNSSAVVTIQGKLNSTGSKGS
jgi:hypothetical protein